MVILVDNNKFLNFFNTQEIEKSRYVTKIVYFERTIDCIDYLHPISLVFSKLIYIFIAINMPQINGWEFIEKALKLKGNLAYLNIILMCKQELDTEEEIQINSYTNVSWVNPFKINQVYLNALFQDASAPKSKEAV